MPTAYFSNAPERQSSDGFAQRGTDFSWRYRALKYWVQQQGTPIRIAKVYSHLTHLSDAEALAIAQGKTAPVTVVAEDEDL